LDIILCVLPGTGFKSVQLRYEHFPQQQSALRGDSTLVPLDGEPLGHQN
jgi:hypothetical protein